MNRNAYIAMLRHPLQAARMFFWLHRCVRHLRRHRRRIPHHLWRLADKA